MLQKLFITTIISLLTISSSLMAQQISLDDSSFRVKAAYGSYKTSEEDSRVNETQQAVVSSHVENAKAYIDRQCQKIKVKIRNFEDDLHRIEKYDKEDYGSDPVNLDKRRTRLRKKIKNYEEKLEAFRTMKLSLEIIDFKAL